MARERIYGNQAERQAAYRARHREREPARQGLLAALARSLHGAMVQAVREERSPLPAELLGQRADETLQRLIRYLHGEAGGRKEG